MKSVKQTDILTGSIPKQLLLFFLPIWFGTLFQQLYNTADTLIVGNFVGTNALAAVGATGPFVNLLVGLFVGLCSGAGVVIAQSWGAHDPDAVDRQVHTALVLSAAVGALLTVLGLVTAAPIMRLLGTPDEILPDAALYLRIYFLGMIPQMLYNMGTNILRAIGDSKRPLYFLIAASLVNIVLDVVFIAVFGWGVMGAALATVLSQVASAVLTLRCIVGSQGMPWHIRAEKLRLHGDVFTAHLHHRRARRRPKRHVQHQQYVHPEQHEQLRHQHDCGVGRLRQDRLFVLDDNQLAGHRHHDVCGAELRRTAV